MRIKRITAGALLASLSAIALASGGEPAQTGPASPLPHEAGFATNKGILPIVDEQGRQLVLQGLNSGGGKHSFMRRSWEQEADVAHQAKNMGYNAHRYLIFWDHVMPQPGVIDQAYLDDVEARLEWFKDNDINVVLDMHQDNWGEQCGGNGAPAWASTGTADPAPGAPWWIVAASPCVVSSQLMFYTNATGLQEKFAQAWHAVAERFAGHPAVIAYDLFNEPTEPNAIVDQMIWEMLAQSDKDLLNFAVLGTIWIDGHPYNAFTGLIKDRIRGLADSVGVAVPNSYIDSIAHVIIARNKGDWGKLNALKEFESGALSDVYQKSINRIREVDQDTYILVEPMSVGVNNGYQTYLRRLHDPRQGERRLGYIPHLYPRDLHEGLPYQERDWARVDLWEKNQRAFAHENNMAWLLGEMGNSGEVEGSVTYLRNVLRMAERNHMGWLYWDSRPYSSWSPIAPDKVSDRPNAQALINVYPRAVAGRIENYHFDRTNTTFTLSYRNTNATGTTDIAVPPRFYPNGLVVTSSDADNTWSYVHDTERNVVRISHNPEALTHTFTVKPTEATQALVYADLRLNQGGRCLDFQGTLPFNGKNALLYDCSNKQWQQWAYDKANQFIRNNQNPEYCLSHGGPEQAKDKGVVAIAACSDSDDHRWVLDGNYIRNIYNTDYVLDAYANENGGNVGQWRFHGKANQQWYWGYRQDSGSMNAMVAGMSNGQHYEMKIKTLRGHCGLQWDGSLGSNNERNAKFDCASQADPAYLKVDGNAVVNSNGSVSVKGLLFSAGNCGLEWDANLSGGERNAKWDCAGSADPVRITTASGGTTVVLESNACGLEWDAKLDKNNERNAKWDCTPHFDEMRIHSLKPVGFLGDLASEPGSYASEVTVNWFNHQQYTTTAANGKSRGRYVRISQSGGDALSLAEVKVFDAQGNNLAQGKPATQSSTVYGGVASRAVDGNTQADWASGSVTHTDSGSAAWWQVDLGDSFQIERVEVYNRTDCCRQRLNGAILSITD